jgi:multiple sugar transport system substrate-binding protein
MDQAIFFTRSKGDLLKGKALEQDFYGVASMQGRYQANDVTSCRLWGKGGDWMTCIRDANGKLTEFVISKKDKAAIREAWVELRDFQPYMSPGNMTADWDFITAQFATGLCFFLEAQFIPLDQWAWTVSAAGDKTGTLGLYLTSGNMPYTGDYVNAVTKDSKNPEAAFWLIRYLSSEECQRQMSEKGWSGVRRDVMGDPKYQTADWYRLIGQRGAYLMKALDYKADRVNNLALFNSAAYGKIYEEQIVITSKAYNGEFSLDDAVRNLVETQMELQKKFGTIPIREEI